MAHGDLVLYTDGGSSSGGHAAAACLITDPGGEVCAALCALLGTATNNESEIFASLLGFAWVNASMPDARALRWVADSEYVLKSATGYIHNWQRNGWRTADKKPVKNQGLWRTFLALTVGKTLIPEHVRGHTGHPENETCDGALNWAKNNAEDVLCGSKIAEAVEICDLPIEAVWTISDARDVIELLRTDESPETIVEEILALVSVPGTAAPRKRRPIDPIAPVLKQLRSAQKSLGTLEPSSRVKKLMARLSEVITEFDTVESEGT